jgi:hypothetical protein
MKVKLLSRVLIALILYLGIRFFGGAIGEIVLYPVRVIISFLHKLGTGLATIFTGGFVEGLKMYKDGTAEITTVGGAEGWEIFGGYLSSIILGNILFYIGAKNSFLSKWALYGLAILMIFVGLKWYDSPMSTLFLCFFAYLFYLVSKNAMFSRELLMFLGLASLTYIVEDLSKGEGAELAKFAAKYPWASIKGWKVIWILGTVIAFLINGWILWSSTPGKLSLSRSDDSK